MYPDQIACSHKAAFDRRDLGMWCYPSDWGGGAMPIWLAENEVDQAVSEYIAGRQTPSFPCHGTSDGLRAIKNDVGPVENGLVRIMLPPDMPADPNRFLETLEKKAAYTIALQDIKKLATEPQRGMTSQDRLAAIAKIIEKVGL